VTFLLSLRDLLAETAHSIAVAADQLITKLEDRYVWVDDDE
jgi:hypothetical protein